MEQVKALPSKSISEILIPTFQIFAPLLKQNASKIQSIRSKTYSYGTHHRQKLDVYEPQQRSSSSPILLFFYGGGLTRGDRILSNVPGSLVYHNVGAFFAKRGFTTIIPDYRRVNDAKLRSGEDAVYPSGGDDVATVIAWLESTFLNSWSPSTTRRDIFLMGNSAGGVHLSTYLLEPKFESERRRACTESKTFSLRGAVLLGVPFDFQSAHPERADALRTYWPPELFQGGSQNSADRYCPLGLLASLKERPAEEAHILISQTSLGVPETLVLLGELDPEDEIAEPTNRFVKLWSEAFNEGPRFELKLLKGHNHISPPLALISGDKLGEKWGEDLVSWMELLSKQDR